MLSRVFRVIVPVAVIGFAAVASAQPRPGAMPSFTLLFMDNVRQELALTPQKAMQIDAILEPLMTTGPSGQKGIRIGRDVDVELLEQRCNKVLSASERARLRQLWLQRDGGLAVARDDVAKELGLTSQQKEKAERILQDMADDMMENARTGGDRSRGLQLRKEASGKIVALFTALQQKKWQSMQGRKFDFKFKMK
jgi:hypothetical protein